MTTSSSIVDIQERHDRLYSEILKNSSNLSSDIEKRKNYEGQIDTLLEEMTEISTKTTSTADYVWLGGAFKQWQELFSMLNIPKDIQLPEPKKELRPPKKTLPDIEIKKWISDKAYYIGKDRKEQLLESIQENPELITQIVWQPYRVLEILGTDIEDISGKRDWYYANIHFVSNVLDRTISFARQISPESYWRLEQHWVDEVKQLMAYLIWRDRGDGLSAELAKSDLYQASEILYRRLNGPRNPKEDFDDAKSYLITHYLQDGRHYDKKKSHDLIKNKARHLFEVTGENDELKNWFAAEGYVKKFYENIIPAAENNDREAALAVLEAIKPTTSPSVVNCFEMALAVYFVRPE